MANRVEMYDDDGRYTDDANAVDAEAEAALKPIWDTWIGRGVCPRTLAHVVEEVLHQLEAATVLERVRPPSTFKFVRERKP